MNSLAEKLMLDCPIEWDNGLLFQILDNFPDVIIILDQQSRMIYVNDACSKFLGEPHHQILGRVLSVVSPKALSLETLATGEKRVGKCYIGCQKIEVIGNTFPIYKDKKLVGAVFVCNPEVEQLVRKLDHAERIAGYLQEQLNEKELPISFKEYMSQNKSNMEILALAAKVAKTNSTVLIRGESGAGKEVMAKAIYLSSNRADKPLIKVNCAAIPENLLESELFGFEDGAFTGAKKGGKVGKFELANNGTLFLDEIGDMSFPMQAKVLRVLQEKEFERIGGTKTIKVDVRVIAATNRPLEKMVEEGTFRQDLYYRINIIPIFLLPLRERKEDLPILAKKLLAKLSKPHLALSPSALQVLMNYEWPGNIRELQNVLEYASIVCNGEEIEIDHLPPDFKFKNRSIIEANNQTSCSNIKNTIASIEKEMIIAALDTNHNNRSAAMKALGMSRRAFYDKLRRYQIAGFN